MSAATGTTAYLAHFRARVLQDAFAEAMPAYWRRRAGAFAAVGTEECYEVAATCRLHAEVLEQTGLLEHLLVELLEEAT